MKLEAKARLVQSSPIDTSNIKKGAFHRWLGKPEDAKITNEDIARGLASKDPHVVKMANFAKNARKWHHASLEDPLSDGTAYDTLIDGERSQVDPEVQELTHDDGGVETAPEKHLLMDDLVPS